MASAHENKTIDANSDLSINDASQNHNIKDLMDDCEDNGTVKLDEDTYYLNPENETHVILNKSITVEGIEGKTVIDGKNTSLFLDVNGSTSIKKIDTKKWTYWDDGYDFKYLGKNVTFKNIIFKDLNMTTWHEMTFENCKFINSTFTSYEYGNTFKNCSFDKSKIEIVLFFGYDEDLYMDYSKIINCSLNKSAIAFKGVYTRNFFHIIGGDPFRIINRLDIMDSRFFNSTIEQYRCNITIGNSSFDNFNITGSSSIYNITDTYFNNPKIEVGYSIISLYHSDMENPQINLRGGYFSIGCELTLVNTTVNNCNLETSVSYGTRIGKLNAINSVIGNSTLNLTYINVSINNSSFNKTVLELFFSYANISNSTFVNDGNITNTIKTRNYKIVYTSKDDEIFTPSVKKCQVKTNYSVENSYFVNGTGKYEIKAEDINMDTTHKITIVNEKGTYNFNDYLIIKVEDYRGNPVNGLKIFIEDLDKYEYPVPSVKTNKNGTAKYSLNKLGKVHLKVYYETDGMQYNPVKYGIDLNLTIKPTVSNIKVTKVNFASNRYSAINSKLKISTVAKSGANLKGLKYAFKVYTNKKAKTYYSLTNSKGIAVFKLPKTLTAGTHKIEIRLLNTNVKKTINVKIAKAKAGVKAPKVTAKVKRPKYFKVTVKFAKKPVKGVKVKVNVFTGKKYKTYAVKTNKKGIARISTNKLKVGRHPVVISSGNKNYKISAKSLITVKK